MERLGPGYLAANEALDGLLLIDLVFNFLTAYTNTKSVLARNLPGAIALEGAGVCGGVSRVLWRKP